MYNFLVPMKSAHVGGRTRRPLPKATLPPSKIQCRFFPNCADLNCPYTHPKVGLVLRFQ